MKQNDESENHLVAVDASLKARCSAVAHRKWSTRMPLLVEELCQHKRLDRSVLTAFDVVQDADGVRFHYVNMHGARGRTRARVALRAEAGSHWVNNEPYPISEYANAVHLISRRDFAFIVEGESDCWTLYRHGFIGVGVPGYRAIEGTSGSRFDLFESLFVVKENSSSRVTFPSGTQEYVERVTSHLRRTGYSGSLFICNPPKNVGDISDLHTGGHDVGMAIDEMIFTALEL